MILDITIQLQNFDDVLFYILDGHTVFINGYSAKFVTGDLNMFIVSCYNSNECDEPILFKDGDTFQYNRCITYYCRYVSDFKYLYECLSPLNT